MAVCTAAPSFALEDIARTFAGCVGRLSAEMEHAWLVDGPEADRIAADRGEMLMLLEATQPMESARDYLAYRIDVKMAHAALLTQASFGQNPQSAENARRLALVYTSQCRDLLLSS